MRACVWQIARNVSLYTRGRNASEHRRQKTGGQTRLREWASHQQLERFPHPCAIESVRIFLCQAQQARFISPMHAGWRDGCLLWPQCAPSRAQFQVFLLKAIRPPASRPRQRQRPLRRFCPAMRGRMSPPLKWPGGHNLLRRSSSLFSFKSPANSFRATR